MGKVLETAQKSAPNNRDFGHNRDRKEQQKRGEAYMENLGRTHSQIYTNMFAKMEYLRLKLFRPAGYSAMVMLAAETVRTELVKIGVHPSTGGTIHIDPVTTILS